MLIHVGSVLPADWNRANATVEPLARGGRLRRGTPAMPAAELARVAEAAGGINALARLSGVSARSLARYIAGEHAVPAVAARVIRQSCREIVA